MDKYLSKTGIEIIKALCANGGEYQSLSRLSVEIDADYKTVWINTLKLCCNGILNAERISSSHGHAYKVSLTCGPVWPDVTSAPHIGEVCSSIGAVNNAGDRFANHKSHP